MQHWEIDIIKAAFARCYGLKEALSNLPDDALPELARQTGLRKAFLLKHLERIQNL